MSRGLWLILYTLTGTTRCHDLHVSWPSWSTDLVDAVYYIAEHYFQEGCMSFLYPRPLVPDLVYSDLLVRLESRWSVTLPCAAPEHYLRLADLSKEPGVHNTLFCPYVVAIKDSNYTPQIESVMYSTWNTVYYEGGGNQSRFVVVVDGEIDKEESYKALKMMTKLGDINAIIVGFEKGVVSIFSLLPFGIDGKSCPEQGLKLVLINQWKGKLLLPTDLFPEKVPSVFNGCQLPVAAVKFRPSFFVKDGLYEGIDFKIIEIVASQLNMTLNITYYDRSDGWLFVNEKREAFGSLRDIRDGKVWAHVSYISNNYFHYPSMVIKTSYITTDSSWYCPNPRLIDSWRLMYLAFSGVLWVFVIVLTIFYPSTTYILSKINKNDKTYRHFWKCVLSFVSIELSNTTGESPKGDVLRILLAFWLYYVTHISNAYTASMAGLITSGIMEPRINSIDDLIERNATTMMQFYIYRSRGYFDEPKLKKLFKTCQPIDRGEMAHMMQYGNSCFIDTDIFIDYLIVRHKILMYRTPVDLVKNSGMGILIRRNHFIIDRVDQIVQRIISAGINMKFINEYTVATWQREGKVGFRTVKLNDVSGPFYLLVCGIIISTAAFICETIGKLVIRKCACFQN